MKKRIGILLSGCGVFDGSEIHEATLTLLYLDREKTDVVCIAPDKDQYHVINHQTSKESGDRRSVLSESARIARGNVVSLKSLRFDDLDGLILPGGVGAAKNLIDYAIKGRNCSIDKEVKQLILDTVKAKKPLGAICIAPMVVAVALRDTNLHPVLTIGMDVSTASDIEYFGAKHQQSSVRDIAIDAKNRIVTTPAYMLGPGISDIAVGIEKLVKQVVDWL